MGKIETIHTNSPYLKNQPLTLSESTGTFVFSREEINLILHEIGKNVRKYRTKYNLSIDKLASLSGITKGTLYKVEKGSTGIGLVVLLKISYVLQVPINNFIPFFYSDFKERKSLGETIDDICCGMPKESELFILNFVKNFVKHEYLNKV